VTPIVALPLLLLLALVVITVVAVLGARRSRRRPEQEATAAVAARPGWKAVTASAGAATSLRYRARQPFDGPNPAFRDLLYGPLPGGAQAETFHFSTTRHHSDGVVVGHWTVALVVFPHPLPSLSVRPTGDPAEAPTPAPVGDGSAQAYDEAAFGPLWAGLRGWSLDPRAAAALFTPEVLGRTRALGLDWRMEGHAVLAVAPQRRPPAAMLELVDHLAWFASLLPEEVLRAAAEQSDPWTGPTAERPA
jgi:hypothetical protein